LGAVHTPDHAVRTALTSLVAADRALVSSNGSDQAAKSAIRSAIKKDDARIDSPCPGVVS
jgi:hypothetical protein